jgi:hypothetical protein
MVAITDYRDGSFVNRCVSLVIIVLYLSYLPLSYYLGMQFQPYLSGPVQDHLRKSVFDLNKPQDVKALVCVVQEVFKAVQLFADNKNAHTECNFDNLLGFQSGGSTDVDGEDNAPPQAKKQKRKRDNKPIDHNRVKKLKDVAKSLGMTCANKPVWSAEATKKALMDAPKDQDGGAACSCIKHGFEVYGGGDRLAAYLALYCPTEGMGNRAPVGSDDKLVRAHVNPQKFQEGTTEKDDKYVIEHCNCVCYCSISHLCVFVGTTGSTVHATEGNSCGTRRDRVHATARCCVSSAT